MAIVESYLGKRAWALALASGILLFLAAQLSELLPHQRGLTALWLPNAVLLAFLLETRHSGRRTALMIGAAAGGAVSLAVRGMPLAMIGLFPLANVLESFTAAALIWRMGGILGTFERVTDVMRMIAAALVAPIAPALIAMVTLHFAFGTPWIESWYAWYGAGALSLVVVTPAAMVAMEVYRDIVFRERLRAQLIDFTALMAVVAGVALLIFSVVKVPSMFVLMPVAVFAAFRQRQAGAIGTVLVIAVIGIETTLNGVGPVARNSFASPVLELAALQVYIGAAFLVSLPVASALTERDARAAESNILAEQFRAVVENVGEVIFRTDSSGRWTYLNPAWLIVSGHDIASSLGALWTAHVEPAERPEIEAWARPVLTGEIETSRRLIHFLTAHNGWRWMEVTMQTLFNNAGQVLGATGTLRDIDDRKRLEEHVLSAKRQAEARAAEAVMLAATDELTGLANRRAFLRHLGRQIEAAGELGQTFALAIFDVDHFKAVNDEYGHAVGDRVLQRVAQRALSAVRSGDLVGRIGGEEFGILMPGASPRDAELAAERLCRAIETQADLLEESLPGVTVSVGVAALQPGGDGSALMARADTALYAAKAGGRNRIKLAA